MTRAGNPNASPGIPWHDRSPAKGGQRFKQTPSTLAAQAAPTPAPPAADSGGSSFKLGWNLYLTPQIWPNIGDDEDHKFGIGFGGMLGIAWVWDELVILIGPHLSYQMWTADYSQKPMSATRRVTFGMADAGLETIFHFDESRGFWAGAGASTMDASMLLDNGDTYYYPGLDKEQFNYLSAGVTFKFGTRGRFGMGVTQYEKAARDANRVEFRFGFGY